MQRVGTEKEAEEGKRKEDTVDTGNGMIVEETTFRSLLEICATPMPTPIHRYKDVYFALAHIGDATYLAISRDGPKEKVPFIEYDLRRREWKLVDPAKGSFSGEPSTVVIPVVDVKELSGKVGEEIKKLLSS